VDEADENALQVAARVVVGDPVDEKGVVRLCAAEPVSGLAGAGVITGDGGNVVASDIVARPAQVVCAETDADDGVVEQFGGIVGIVETMGDLPAGAGRTCMRPRAPA